MDWYIAYDVMRDWSWSFWGLHLVPLIFAILGLYIAKNNIGLRSLLGGTLCLAGLLAFLGASFYSVKEFLGLRKLYENGIYIVVEGEVVDFVGATNRRDPKLQQARRESFRVNDTVFSYHHATACLCFNETALSGGPLKEGLYVRIWHIGNKIIRLEIANEDGM